MVGVALVSLTALSVFHNAQIINRREDAPRRDVVETGDPFDAPWLVAKDLVMARLAKAEDPEDLDDEPTEPLDPHPSISAPDLKRHNGRRQGRAPRDTGEAGSAVAGAALTRAAPAPEATHRVETAPAPGASTGVADGAGATPLASVSPAAPTAPAAPQAITSSTVKSNVPPIPPAPAAEAAKP